jgi:hypothetical protein
MTIVLPSAASGHGTCSIDSRSSIDAPVLLQQSFTPTAPVITAVAKQSSRARLAPYSLVEAGSDTANYEHDLSFAKKCGFLVLSVLYLVASAIYMKRIIDDYEDAASISTPPWYMDTRMLIKITCVTFLSWLFLGLLAFTQVLLFNDPPRHLTVIESLYLSSQIITTVGYGDLTPTNPIGQLFLAFYVLFGVTLVAIVVAAVMDHIMAENTEASSETLPSETFYECNEQHPGDADHNQQPSQLAKRHPDEQHLGVVDHNQVQGTSQKAGTVDDLKHHSHQDPKDAMFRGLGVFLIAVSIGTSFFYFYPGEDKTIWQAFYLSCVSLTTVGFGAIHPQTQGGCLFATFWMLIGVSCTANMICTLGDSLLKHRRDLTSTLMKEECLKEMDADGSGKVDKMEFLRFELVRRGVCKKHDIDNVLAIFDALDTDHSGELDFEDLKKFVL